MPRNQLNRLSRLRLPCGLIVAAAVCLLAAWPAAFAQVIGNPGAGQGNCGGGAITVTVTVDEPQVLVGHEATFRAAVSGNLCAASWNPHCPGFTPSYFNYESPPPGDVEVCCDNIGPMEYTYAATSGGGHHVAQFDDDSATVTVVMPNKAKVYGYGTPSVSQAGGGSFVDMTICPERDGERVGRCAAPAIAAQKYVKVGTAWVPDGNGFQQRSSMHWDTLRRCMVHRLSSGCSAVNDVEDGEFFGELRFRYRFTYDTQCGETDGEYITGVITYVAERTGDCTFTVRPTGD